MTYKEAVALVKQAAVMESPVAEGLRELASSYDNAGKWGIGDRLMSMEPGLTNIYNRMARQAAVQDAAGTLTGLGTGGVTAASIYGLTGLIPKLKKSRLLRLMLAGLGGGLGYTAGKLGMAYAMHPYDPNFNYKALPVR